jgi:transcriptional regulator with XRE-family HTH domain
MTNKNTNQIDIIIGKRIRVCRRNANMSQESLGNALGITFQQIQNYELGTNRITAGRLYEIADLFGVPVSYFYKGLYQAEQSDPPTANDDAVSQALDRIKNRTRRDLAIKLILTILKEFETD